MRATTSPPSTSSSRPARKAIVGPGVDPLKYAEAHGIGLLEPRILHGQAALQAARWRHEQAADIGVEDKSRSFGEASEDLKFASAVAGFGMLLRGSTDKGSLTYAGRAEIAEPASAHDPSGYRREFLAAVRPGQESVEAMSRGRD